MMTIDYHITVGDPLSAKHKEFIQKIINSTFEEIDSIYNKWNPLSEISKINQLDANIPHQLSPNLNDFLIRLDLLVSISEGRFDPTIEPLQSLWKHYLDKGMKPSNKEIEGLRPCLGWKKIHLANGILYKDDKKTQLDLGGVAKGLCVDLLIERLHQAGLNNVMVEWGGDMRAIGYHPSKRPWKIYIRGLSDPDPLHAIAEVELINRALATSGDYYQFWKLKMDNGKEKVYCHIFNPLSLSPLEVSPGSVASASIIALDCVSADALAKVLMLFPSVGEAETWMLKIQQTFPEMGCWIVTR